MKVNERIGNIVNKMKNGAVLYMYEGSASRKMWSLQEDGVCNAYEDGTPITQDIINYMVSEKLIQVDEDSVITRAILTEDLVSSSSN